MRNNISKDIKILDIADSNELLTKKILSREPFFVSRVGFHELGRMMILSRGSRTLFEKFRFINGYLKDPAYTLHLEDAWRAFSRCYLEGYLAADIQCIWVGTRMDEQIELLSKCKNFVRAIDSLALSPYHLPKPWTGSLIGKKVLLVSPFVDDLQRQHLRSKEIWANGESLLPAFEIIPYKTDFYFYKSSRWIDFFLKIRDDVSSLSFDIALISCGPIGTPLGAYIRNEMKRSAIYMGAALQTLFGVTGSRWDKNEYVQKFANDSWIRPTSAPPKGAEKLDNSCYW